MPAADRRIEGARIAIQVWEFPAHLGERMEIFPVQKAALRCTMRRDNGYAAFQRSPQDARIGIFRPDYRNGVFAAGMRK